MNILLWVCQVIVAAFCIMGATWRFLNYQQAAREIASIGALSYGTWNAIGIFETVCALGLILPGIFGAKPVLTTVAAALLAVEMLLVSGLHVHYFGFQLRPSNPATWTIALAVLAVFVAYGRTVLKPI